MTGRKWLLLLAGVLTVSTAIWALPSTPNIWDITYEGAPAVGDPVSEGDDNIRVMKEETRQRMEVEHQFGTQNGGADNGLHWPGSGRCFYSAATPTTLEGGALAAPYNNSGGATSADLTASGTNGDSFTVGEGRCWLSQIDRVLYVHTGTTWIRTHPISTTNLLPNSWFSGQDSANTEASSPAVGEGWALLLTPDIDFAAKPSTEGAGLLLRTTANGATDEGVKYTLTGLKASATYWFTARVKATAGDSCTMRMNTSGGTDVPATTTTPGSAETISGLVTLDATPTGEVIELESDADGDICDWYSVGLYEMQTPLYAPQPNVAQVQQDSTTTGAAVTTGTDVSGVEVAMVAPADHYYIKVSGHSTIGCDGAASTTFGIYQSVNGAAATACATGHFDPNDADIVTESLSCLVSNPTPGAEYAYTWRFVTVTGTCHVNESNGGGADLGETRLVMEMTPR